MFSNIFPYKNWKIRSMKSRFLDINKKYVLTDFIMCASPKTFELATHDPLEMSCDALQCLRLASLSDRQKFWEGRRDSCESRQHLARHR